MVMATSLVNAGLGYLFWIAAARLFAPPDVGRATAAISSMNLVALVATLGVGAAIIGHLPGFGEEHGRRSRYVTATVAYTGLAATIGGILLVTLLPLIDDQFAEASEGWAHVVLAVGVLAQTWGVIFDQLFVAERRSEGMFVRNSLFGTVKLVVLVAGGAAVAAGERFIISSWVAASALSIVVCVFLLVPRLTRSIRASTRGLTGEIRGLAGPALMHHLAVLGGEVPLFVLPILVVARAGAEQGAFFYTTWMVGGLFFMISAALSQSLYAEGSHDPEALAFQRRRALRLISVLLVPAMVAMLLLGPFVLRVFGADYARAGYPLLVVLVGSAIPDAVTNLGVADWRVRGHRGWVAMLNVAMAVVAVVGAWILVPRLGIVGAGWAWFVAQGIGCAGIWAERLARRGRATAAAR
jgi:O-antigen/teichoic acid export membrane protein